MDEPDATTEEPGGIADPGNVTVPAVDSPAELASILDGYMAELLAGRAPDRQRLFQAHPELATQLEACLAGIEFIHRATGPATETPATLGEFRIIRELGRGGMGVVYEAEQTWLRRHVALKVLRFGVVADEDAMNRFRREDETVARLRHTNIVPIFAVGCEQGVHYYAMQYIEGRSLADVLAESKETANPVPVEDLARWGLQAAEALAHAHQRGVIHRDIKPSNLLLDHHGVVWLTDFGLAKRMDEATLTVRGTLMGTPRYMSPEQAAVALRQPVDRRSDLYSLGATLYELATGSRLFASTQPHLGIAQILSEEPARPRQIRPALPRDFETVILKCLAKEPHWRYQSALELASDLRAVLEARPIKARRTPSVARIKRYVRTQRKMLTGAGIAGMGTMLVLAAALAGWRYYSDWRLGRVALTTDGPPLAAELLPASSGDQSITEPFYIVARGVVAMPAGDYRLRVSGTGLLSQTYKVAFNRGETRTHNIVLSDNRLLGGDAIPFALVTEAVRLIPGKTDFIEWNGESLVRRDGSTGKLVWDGAQSARSMGPQRDPVAALRRLSRFGDEKRPGKLVQPAPDLDSDGTGDLAWAIYGTPSLLVLSGKDGSVLWTYSADPDKAHATPLPEVLRPGRIMGAPAVADVDRDGTMDLIAEFAIFDDPEPLVDLGRTPALGRRTIAAISGRSGKELWSNLIDAKPVDLRPEILAHGVHYVSQSKGSFVAFVDGKRQLSLDPATGQACVPAVELGFAPIPPIQFVDVDGDGCAEILALERQDYGFEAWTEPKLAAFSVATGERLWVKKLKPFPFLTTNPPVPVWDWPLAADFDSDGRAEIVIPDVVAFGPRGDALYAGVRMLDGATGEPRWDCPLWPGGRFLSTGLIRLLAAPDLDADGTRDLVVVSRYDGRIPYEAFVDQFPGPTWIYVDTVSGKDGHKLWSWRTEIIRDSTPVRPLLWCGLGSDGWPMLAIPIGGNLEPGVGPINPFFAPDPPIVHLLAAATGLEEHVVAGLSWPMTADLNGDGLADLWGAVDGKLVAIRGEPPEAWRALGGLKAAGDLDGDGLTDVISSDLVPPSPPGASWWGLKNETRTALARSGRDGMLLWRSRVDAWKDWLAWWGQWGLAYRVACLPTPGGDLDGDGFPEVLVGDSRLGPGVIGQESTALPLEALSGRTGRLLWSAGLARPSPPLGARLLGGPRLPFDGNYIWPGAGNGQPDVFVLYLAGFEGRSISPATFDEHARLARVSGRDGRVLWDVLVAEYKGGLNWLSDYFVHDFADLDGDGDPEMVLLLNGKAASGTAPFGLRVLSLASGDTRWSHPLNPGAVGSPTCVVGDLDGDRRPDVVVQEQPRDNDDQTAVVVTAYAGLTGAPLWTWRGGTAHDKSGSNPSLRLADFHGSGRREICVSFAISGERRRVEILNANGSARVGRDVKPGDLPALTIADLDGDGRDELLFHDSGRLRACRGDLSELWSLPTREAVREVLPAAPGRAATVVVNPSLGIDGATGRPIWSIGSARSILRANDGASLPRALAGPDGATVCRVAMPATADGFNSAARGVTAKSAAFDDDSRWKRPLPWVGPVPLYKNPLVEAAMGATLVNVCIPVAILWLATRQRFWSVRLLLALPAAVAVIMTGSSTLISLLPERRQPAVPPWWELPLGVAKFSMSGLPIVAYAVDLVMSVIRRRWRRTGLLVVAAAVVAVVIATMMLVLDLPFKLAIEQYSWWGSEQALFWGAYVVGVLTLLAPSRAAGRFVLRLALRCRRMVSRLI